MGEIPNLVKISVSLKIQPNDGPVYFKVDGQRFGQNRTIKLLTGAKYKIEVALKPGAVRAKTMNLGGLVIPLEEKSRDPQMACYTAFYDTEGVTHTKSGERQPLQVMIQERILEMGIPLISIPGLQDPRDCSATLAVSYRGGLLVLISLHHKDVHASNLEIRPHMPLAGALRLATPGLIAEGLPVKPPPICCSFLMQEPLQFEDIGSFETVWQVKFYNYHKRDHCQWGNSFSSIEYECKPNETRSLMWINKEMFH